MHQPSRFILLVLTMCWGLAAVGFSQSQVNPRAEWFVDARLGMFIHWGVYSGAEGVWKGEKLRYDNDYAEWIFYRNRISREEYLSLLNRFDWSSVDPETWVILAKKAGMKYVTLTAKHHDGFALWDSQVGDFDIGEYTRPKRDIVAELAAACRKHGLRLGLYYSHWVDWEHPFGWDHTREIDPISEEQYDRYWQEKVMPQMRELLTRYGDIGLIWFDMWIHHSQTIVSKDQLLQLKTLIRELQPDCLINSRLGLSVEEDPDVDFRTLGDNTFGTMKLDYPWQSPATIAHSWGYHALEDEWKSTTTLLSNLISNVSLNGNMMLNIGPRANGDVPWEMHSRLLEIGDWLRRNGESVYGAGGFDLDADQHDWCRMTSKQVDGKTRVYCHIPNWPLHRRIKLTGITTAPSRVFLLHQPDQDIPFSFSQVVTAVQLPAKQPDPLISVLVLEFDEQPPVQTGVVAESMSGGYAMTPDNWIRADGSAWMEKASRFGSVPEHVEVTEASRYEWLVYLDEPGHYQVDMSWSNPTGRESGQGRIRTTGNSASVDFLPTGLTVGEPKSNWHVPAFVSSAVLDFEVQEAGYYPVILDIQPAESDTVLFQWVWLSKRSISP